MDYDPEIIAAIRDALAALQDSHPDVLVKVAAAVRAAKGRNFKLPELEAAFREAAATVVPSDKSAAETLFTMAELLAQIPREKLK